MSNSTLTAAARSICPGAAPGAFAPPCRGGIEGTPETGRGAVGMGGFPGTFGFEATGGGAGLGFAATGGGLLARELAGRDPVGLESLESSVPKFLFQGAADPFDDSIPGSEATTFACASPVLGLAGADGVAVVVEGAGGGLRLAGGGGG